MRLLFTKRGFSPVGGSESLAYQFATRLAARGHDVRVVCAWPTEKEESSYRGATFRPVVHDDHRVFTDQGVEVIQVKPRGGILGMAADATTLVDLMRGELLERYAEDRDLIHNVGREYLDSSVDVAGEIGIPLVLTPLAHPGQFHGGDAAADFGRYRRASSITTMTDWERGWYVSHGIDVDRVVTTGMGPNATAAGDADGFRARHRIPAGAPIVLYIGRKERYKGYIQLLDATEAVWRTHPDTRFVFIGLPGFYSTFFDDFQRYADERIIHLESASAADKDAALEACSLFAMPSRHETFGLGYLEAWLHGKPVIGGDIPALRDVIDVGRDGFVVPQRPAEVAHAILRLLDDPVAAAAMGALGRRKVEERWSWDAVIDRVEAAYAIAMNAETVTTAA
ncbi:MAG: glycosyltransferase family 4 protein [Chloroflexota bacterium]